MERLDLYRVTKEALRDEERVFSLVDTLDKLLSKKFVCSLENISVYELTLYEKLLDRDCINDLYIMSLIKTAFRYDDVFSEFKEVVYSSKSIYNLVFNTNTVVTASNKVCDEYFNSVCSTAKKLVSLRTETLGNNLDEVLSSMPASFEGFYLRLLNGYYFTLKEKYTMFSLSSIEHIFKDDGFIYCCCALISDVVAESFLLDTLGSRETGKSFSNVDLDLLLNFLVSCCDNMERFSKQKVSYRFKYTADEEDKLQSKLNSIKKLAKKSTKYVPKTSTNEIACSEEEAFSNLAPITFDAALPIKKLTDAEKIAKSEKLNLLVLASNRVKFNKSKLRVEDIHTVSDEVLKASYDGVVIVTKFIGHKDSFRVKSCVNSPLFLTSTTNYKKFMIEMYDNIYGRGV